MHQHHAKQRLFAPKLHSFSLFIRPQKRSMNSSIGTLHHRLCILLFRRQHKCGHNKLQKSFVTLSQYTDTDIPWQYGAQQMKQQNIKRSHGAAPGPRQWTASQTTKQSPRGLTAGIEALSFLKTTILHFIISPFLDRHLHSKSPITEQSCHYAHHRRGSHHHRRREPKRERHDLTKRHNEKKQK